MHGGEDSLSYTIQPEMCWCSLRALEAREQVQLHQPNVKSPKSAALCHLGISLAFRALAAGKKEPI